MIWLYLFVPGIWAATELLTNVDFEDTHVGAFNRHNWWCLSCKLSSSYDSYHGNHSGHVSTRTHDYSGVNQYINAPLKVGHGYFFRANIKLLNGVPNKLYYGVHVQLVVRETNGKLHYEELGQNPHIQVGGWHVTGGEYHVSLADIAEARINVKPYDSGIDYLVDYATFQELPSLTNFKNDANNKINQIRKADISVRLADTGIEPSDLTVEIVQTSSQFAFGSAVQAGFFVDPNFKKYQDYFYDNFEWAVIENKLKWYNMEPQQGHIDYTTPMAAVDALRHRGVKVRGHNIFWETNYPNWQKNMTGSELRKAMEARINGVVGHFKGKLEHWDVDNEALHGDFYSQKTGDANITMWMFQQAHHVDPSAKLFLNDYGIINYQKATVAIADQARYFRDAGVPLYGVGIQSHMHVRVDISAIKHRLDEVARAGLPIWITELTVEGEDNHAKADYFEDLLRLYFSHPAVEGVLFWGFWNRRMSRPESSLVDGNNLTPNEAGTRVQQLIKQEWRTHVTHSIVKGQTVHVRGFKGNYKLNVKHHNNVIHEENFYLGYRGSSLHINISGTVDHPLITSVAFG